MSNFPGLGVMIHELCGGRGNVDKFKESIGKKIKSVSVDDNELKFIFDDDSELTLFDDGQSCCESRYMTTDDELSEFIGATLENIELADGPDIEEEYDTHEVQFLRVKTNNGDFTISNHNEHNGYYGGFWIVIK